MLKKKSNKSKRKCATKGCRNHAEHNRTICGKCRIRKWRAAHPMKAAYLNLKHRAKRRHKPFNLTYEQFCQFAVKYDYLGRRGNGKECITIDCYINEKGYVADNIHPLTRSDNSKKGVKMLHYDYRTGEAVVFSIRADQLAPTGDCPF